MPLNHTHQSFNRETLLTQPHTLPGTWSRGRKPDLLLLWMLTSPSLSIPGDLLRVPTGAVWFPSHRISDTRNLHRKERARCRQLLLTAEGTLCAYGFLLGSLRRSPLTCRSPARTLCLLGPTAPSPVQAAQLPSPCFTASVLHPPLHPPAASRSWLLYVSPAWLTPLALVGSTPMDSVKVSPLILTALPAHLVTADPSARLSRSLPCCVLCSVRHIFPVNNFSATLYLFIYFWNSHNSGSRSERFKPFFCCCWSCCCHFLIPKERNQSCKWASGYMSRTICFFCLFWP